MESFLSLYKIIVPLHYLFSFLTRERLHWSQVPLTGYGGSNAVGSAATTLPDGSPALSVEDEVLPLSFFNRKTGEFVDTPQARSRARMCMYNYYAMSSEMIVS